MGEGGLEPPVPKGADLQSARLPVTGYSPRYEVNFEKCYKILRDSNPHGCLGMIEPFQLGKKLR